MGSSFVTSFSSSISGSLGSEKTAAHEEFSSPSPLGNGKGKAFEVETRLSRPTSAARLLPTISSPSLTAEGRNPLVGGGDAAPGGAFRFGPWQTQGGHEGNQQLRDGSLLPARTLRTGTTEAGEGDWVLVVEGFDQFRAVEVCVVDEQPHLVVRELLGWHAGVGNRLHLTRVRELAVKPCGMDVL